MADWQIDLTSTSEDTTVFETLKSWEQTLRLLKKSKMDSETVKRKMISEANIKTSDAYKFILEENNKKIIAGIDFKLEPLTRGLVVSLTNMIPCITLSHWMCLILDPFNKSVCIHLSHNSNF